MKQVGYFRRLLAGLCTLALLASCSFAPKEGTASGLEASGSDASNVAMGRYIEEEYALPAEINILADGIDSMPDGRLSFIGCSHELEHLGPWSLFYSEDGGKSWEKQEAPWLQGMDSEVISHTAYGADGSFYFITQSYTDAFQETLSAAMQTGVMPAPEEYPPYILHQVAPDGNMSDIRIQWVPDEDGYVNLLALHIAENGDIVVQHQTSAVHYDRQTGEAKHTFLTGFANYNASSFLYDDIYAFVTNNEVQQYSLANGDTLDSISLAEGDGSALFVPSRDGKALYRCDGRGIYRLVKGGSIWERLLDGELSSLTLPSVRLQSLLEKEEGFLVLVREEGRNIPLSYRFDETIPTVPEKAFTIYSLYENSTIRQAAGLMQRAHPEVRVDYTAALAEESGQTASDAVRALNTELLAGKGPDVLLLDGLPLQSYIAKGVLLDLKEAVAPEANVLLPNIVQAFQQESGLLAIPTRFAVPHMWGKDAFIDAAADFESMAAYIEEYHRQNPDSRALLYMAPSELMEDFYYTCAPAFRAQDGSIRREEFMQFLSGIKQIADTGDMQEIGYPYDAGIRSILWASDDGEGTQPEILCYLSQSMEDLAFPDAYCAFVGGRKFALMAGQAENVFVPQGILGVNRAGQQELAKEFVALALSERVQGCDFEDGYPVRLDMLQSLSASPYPEGDDGKQVQIFVDGEEKWLQVLWPSEEFMQGILETMQSLSTPSILDPVLLQMIVEETREYFAGSKGLEETADAVIERTQAYLSE